MFKIPKKLSLTLSIVLSIAFFLACIAGAIIMPRLSGLLIDARDTLAGRTAVTDSGRTFVLVLAYLVIAAAVLADGLLFSLLLRVRAGAVFTAGSVARIRGVSWCCFLICAAFCALGFYFYLAFAVAFVAAFLGLCLRVVKNVIEEATAIKAENDLTV